MFISRKRDLFEDVRGVDMNMQYTTPTSYNTNKRFRVNFDVDAQDTMSMAIDVGISCNFTMHSNNENLNYNNNHDNYKINNFPQEKYNEQLQCIPQSQPQQIKRPSHFTPPCPLLHAKGRQGELSTANTNNAVCQVCQSPNHINTSNANPQEYNQCHFCEKLMCSNSSNRFCAKVCEQCGYTFCQFCSTINYSFAYEKVMCIDCNQHVQ